MSEKRNVVIVGAGPVGFLTALGLARQGIEVTVLDCEAAIVRSPRAAVYFHTTLSVLNKLGLIEDAEAIGLASTDIKMHWPETGEVAHTDMRDALDPGQEFDHNLHFGQHILAELVMEHLERLPHTQVLWNHRVTGLEQTGSKAVLAVETPQGTATIAADWSSAPMGRVRPSAAFWGWNSKASPGPIGSSPPISNIRSSITASATRT